MDDDRDILDILSQLYDAERQFYGLVRFLDGAHRTHVVAAHERNTNLALSLLREYMRSSPVANMTVTIPIPVAAMDASGNFFDPVPVVPTTEQVRAATETHVNVVDETCAICQETVECATRIRQCGHCFHSGCIGEWFSMNPRCPVCRHDIRSASRYPTPPRTRERATYSQYPDHN
jgi:hypothetical protein